MQYQDNLFTYLKWRGDLSLKVCPFQEVDALILSELAYIRLDGIVPQLGAEGTISIREANLRYTRLKERDMLFHYLKEDLFDQLAQSPRFSEMTLSDYISTLDTKAQQQFAAVHINIAPGQVFIAFRGTDNSLTGWREDFNMSFMMPVPAQQSAVDYVNQTAKGLFKKYWIGGHSKGGNLAVYAAVFCDPKLQKKIAGVYSFDGPGFHRSMVDDIAFKRIEDRIHTFVPESSIVGMLMEHGEDYKVVKSTEFAIRQHEGCSWMIDRDSFVLVDDVEEFSKNFSVTLRTWLAEMSIEERKELVDAFFDVFENAGIENISDIADLDVRTTGMLIKEVTKVPQKQRDRVMKLLKLLIEENTKK